MKQITLNIEETNFSTFMEFIKTLDYVKIEHKEENKLLVDLENSLKQVKSMKDGKLPSPSIKDLLNECRG